MSKITGLYLIALLDWMQYNSVGAGSGEWGVGNGAIVNANENRYHLETRLLPQEALENIRATIELYFQPDPIDWIPRAISCEITIG